MTASTRELARAGALVLGGGERLRGEQDGTLAPVARLVDQAAALVALEPVERAAPVAGRAAIFEHRLTGPGRRRRMLGGLLGVGVRGHRVGMPLRLDIKAVQAKQLGVVARRHHVEGALGCGAVARELRGLRAEQERERLARRQAPRLVGELLGGAHVAGGDRDQPLRHRLIAAHAALRLPLARELSPASAGARAVSDHSKVTATAIATTATSATITEVSTRVPCQVMATSPGRSASQTAPNATAQTMNR